MLYHCRPFKKTQYPFLKGYCKYTKDVFVLDKCYYDSFLEELSGLLAELGVEM